MTTTDGCWEVPFIGAVTGGYAAASSPPRKSRTARLKASG
jgi:hypothetical protein